MLSSSPARRQSAHFKLSLATHVRGVSIFLYYFSDVRDGLAKN